HEGRAVGLGAGIEGGESRRAVDGGARRLRRRRRRSCRRRGGFGRLGGGDRWRFAFGRGLTAVIARRQADAERQDDGCHATLHSAYVLNPMRLSAPWPIRAAAARRFN